MQAMNIVEKKSEMQKQNLAVPFKQCCGFFFISKYLKTISYQFKYIKKRTHYTQINILSKPTKYILRCIHLINQYLDDRVL